MSARAPARSRPMSTPQQRRSASPALAVAILPSSRASSAPAERVVVPAARRPSARRAGSWCPTAPSRSRGTRARRGVRGRQHVGGVAVQPDVRERRPHDRPRAPLAPVGEVVAPSAVEWMPIRFVADAAGPAQVAVLVDERRRRALGEVVDERPSRLPAAARTGAAASTSALITAWNTSCSLPYAGICSFSMLRTIHRANVARHRRRALDRRHPAGGGLAPRRTGASAAAAAMPSACAGLDTSRP